MGRNTLKALALTVGLSLSAASAAAEEPLRIGVEAAYPPFAMKTETGELTGFDIEIAAALCAEMGRTCEYVESDWDAIIPGLLARKFDAIVASMGITPERQKRVDFTNRYYSSNSGLVAAVDTDMTADAAGTAGRTIGIQRGTAHECYVKAHFPDAELRQYATTEEIYLDLTAGRLDGVVADSIPAGEWLKTDDAEGYGFVSSTLHDAECFGEGVGIAIRQEDDDLRMAFNEAIAAIRADGTYQQINDKYFDFDIYGGDE